MLFLRSNRLDHAFSKNEDQSECVFSHGSVEHTPDVSELNVTGCKFGKQYSIDTRTAPLNPTKVLCQMPGLSKLFCPEIPAQQYFCFRQTPLHTIQIRCAAYLCIIGDSINTLDLVD